MRRLFLVPLAGIFFLTACEDAKKPSDGNFRKAIDQYLAKNGKTCMWIVRPFPIDISIAEQKFQSGIVPQMAALEQAGLVRSSNTTAVVHGMLDALRGSTPLQPVKRYELTDEGKRYFQQSPGVFGLSSGFCYGEKVVDGIVKWTEPMAMGSNSQTTVTYTYRIEKLAAWAKRPEVQREFGDVRTTLSGVSKSNEIAGLQLTDKGWEVPTQ